MLDCVPLLRMRTVSQRSRDFNICAHKIVADEQQRQVQGACHTVAHAVAIVERGRVSPFAESLPCVEAPFAHGLCESDLLDAKRLHQLGDRVDRRVGRTLREHNFCFEHGRSADVAALGGEEFGREPVRVGLCECNGY